LLNPATIILFFVLAIAWAVFGHVDIIATASGKIVPTGRTKTIQPLETGIVSAIYVQDGDHVTAGQVLIELDRTVTQAERKHIAQDLVASQLDVARLAALRDSFDAGTMLRNLVTPAGASEADVARRMGRALAKPIALLNHVMGIAAFHPSYGYGRSPKFPPSFATSPAQSSA
jgi:hemolysin D